MNWSKIYGNTIKTADIKQFANPKDIPPVYYDKPYYVVPTKGGERAYATLRDVLREHAKNAIVQIVLRTREHVAALGVHGDMLMMYQLRYAAELVPRAGLKTPALPKPDPAERDALSAVINRFSAPFFAEDYHDEYSEGVRELVERKAKGLPMPRAESKAPHATPEENIVDALQATLQGPQQLNA
jgi:DNA end-binding protein Ku